jgi:hypothetical protein
MDRWKEKYDIQPNNDTWQQKTAAKALKAARKLSAEEMPLMIAFQPVPGDKKIRVSVFPEELGRKLQTVIWKYVNRTKV